MPDTHLEPFQEEPRLAAGLSHRPKWKDGRKMKHTALSAKLSFGGFRGFTRWPFGGLTGWTGAPHSVTVEAGGVRDEVHPEIEAEGWVVFTALVGECCGVDLVPRLSE
jgi:hypothetical protein